MNFDTINTAACIPGTGGSGSNGSGGSGGGGSGGGGGGGSNPSDPRCSDATFAAANPAICGNDAYIVLKPSSSIISVLGSVQFNVFLYQNGQESQLSSGLTFGSSDNSIFVIGASSGNGTGLASGEVTVTASWQGLSATASVTVVSSTIGCSETPVATAILLDNSASAAQTFGGSYSTLLKFARAVALAYSGNILQVNGQPKDTISIFSFNDTPTQVSDGFISDTTLLASQINSVLQSQGGTDIKSALVAAISALQGTSASIQVILLISDGIQTDSPTLQDVLSTASAFTQSGGIIMCIGCRAALGFDLLERCATGGFFINCIPSNAATSLDGLSYLKSAVCAGQCVNAGDFYQATGESDYSSFLNWSVVTGQVNLLGNGYIDLLPGNGLYIQLANAGNAATLESIDTFQLTQGDTYEISFSAAGNNEEYTPSANQGVLVQIKDAGSNQIIFQQTVTPDWNSTFQSYNFSFTAQYAARVKIFFQQVIAPGYTGDFAGNLLDAIQFKDLTSTAVLLDDDLNDENVQYIPPSCGPSAALAALHDPSALAIQWINFQGGSQNNGETYKYAFSYRTLQGETNLSPVVSTATLTPITVPFLATLLSGIFPVPIVYPPNRIAGIRIWRNDNSGSDTLYLLAEIATESINYVDTLDHAQFAAIVDTSIIAPVSNTTAVSSGQLGFGMDGCYEPPCDSSAAIGGQSPDPNPLPNLEAPATGGGGGGTTFQSTQQYCASCPAGEIGSLTPVMTSLNTPSGTCATSDNNPLAFYAFDQVFATDINPRNGWWKPNAVGCWVSYQFPNAIVCSGYAVSALLDDGAGENSPTAWQLQGSNDGTTWTTLDTQAGQTFSAASLYVNKYAVTNSTAYSFLRVLFTHTSNNDFQNVTPYSAILPLLEIVFYGAQSQQVCMSASASSTVSQAAADQAATLAAKNSVNFALTNIGCVSGWTSTKSYTAACACNQFGQSVTKTVTYTSLISQADADAQATTLAQTQAVNALICTLSNNTQQIQLQTSANVEAQAAPYPSVWNNPATGVISKVVVNIGSIKCGSAGNIGLLLLSPTGKSCILMYGAGGTGQLWNNLAIKFDDAAGSQIPNTGFAPVNNASYKTSAYTPLINFLGCPPDKSTWGANLSVFNGDDQAGSWALFVIAIGSTPTIGLTTINGFTLTIT